MKAIRAKILFLLCINCTIGKRVGMSCFEIHQTLFKYLC